MDFSWFLTVPGMLITGGVLLLIIALIIFITTSGKKQKKEKAANTTAETNGEVNASGLTPPAGPEVNSTSIADTQSTINPTDASIGVPGNNVDISSPVEPSLQSEPPTIATTPPSMNTPSVSVEPQVTNATTSEVLSQPQPSLVGSTDMSSTPDMSITNTTVTSQPEISLTSQPDTAVPPTVPSVEVGLTTDTAAAEIPAIDIPIASEVPPTVGTSDVSSPNPELQSTETITPQEVSPAVTTTVDNTSVAVSEQPTVAVTPEVPSIGDSSSVTPISTPDATPVATQPVSIYGGADPTVSNINVNNSNHQIYGGADPLENTQVISTPTPDVTPAVESQPVMSQATPAVTETPVTPVVTETPVAPAVAETPVAPAVTEAPVTPITPVVQAPESGQNNM